jgi:hypothetical protein
MHEGCFYEFSYFLSSRLEQVIEKLFVSKVGITINSFNFLYRYNWVSYSEFKSIT